MHQFLASDVGCLLFMMPLLCAAFLRQADQKLLQILGVLQCSMGTVPPLSYHHSLLDTREMTMGSNLCGVLGTHAYLEGVAHANQVRSAFLRRMLGARGVVPGCHLFLFQIPAARLRLRHQHPTMASISHHSRGRCAVRLQ